MCDHRSAIGSDLLESDYGLALQEGRIELEHDIHVSVSRMGIARKCCSCRYFLALRILDHLTVVLVMQGSGDKIGHLRLPVAPDKCCAYLLDITPQCPEENGNGTGLLYSCVLHELCSS